MSIPFATLCDPLVSSEQDACLLVDAAIDLARDLKVCSLEIRTCASRHLVGQHALEETTLFKHHDLTLDQPPEILIKRFHRTSIRPLVRRCEQTGLVLRRGASIHDLQVFFDAYVVSRRRLGLPPQPFTFFDQLWRVFGTTGRMAILTAYSKESPVASLIVFRYRDRVTAEYIGVHDRLAHLLPSHFLFWQAIKQAYAEGYRIFDFGRTSTNNQGLMDFKSRWGTTVSDLPQFHLAWENGCSMLNQEGSFGYRVIKAITRRAPRRAVTLLGELCYRHMG